MSTINKQYTIKHHDGTFNVIHFETSAQQVLTDDSHLFVTREEKEAINSFMSGGSNSSFEFTQGNPMTSWVVKHDLNKFPNVIILDDLGTVIMGDISYTDTNVLTINFNQPVSGTAYLQ